MIRAAFQNKVDGEPVLIIGLEEENVLRLRADKPIDVALKEFGVDLPGRLIILYGRNGLEIEAAFKRAGLLPRDAQLPHDSIAVEHANLATDESHVLVATVGLPYSGKSTWARTRGYPIVCPDDIRTALHGQRYVAEAEPFVWAIAKTMVRSLFYSGHRFVILDACNNTKPRRDEWKSAEWALRFKYFAPDIDQSLKRAQADDDKDIEMTIIRMNAQHVPLCSDELAFV